jgi:outer membrane protein TolC
MRASAARDLACAVLALPALAGCAALTRPEGAGGWSRERRGSELSRAAAAAEVPWQESSQALALASEPDSEAPLDLARALALAGARNRRIAEAREQLDEARWRVYEARGRFLPTTTASGRYAWYTDQRITDVDFPPGVLPPGVDVPVVAVQEQDFGSVNATVALPIDLSGEIRHALLAAQAGYRGEAARAWAVQLDEEMAVTRAYFGLLEAQRLREVTLQTQAANRTQLSNAQKRFDEGRLTKNELLVVEVAESDTGQELLQRELMIARWRWALNQRVGLPVDAPTRVVDVTEPPLVPSPEEALSVGFESNPLLIALLEEQQRLAATTTALERGWLPRFEAGGSWDASNSDLIEPQDYGAAFVGFRWDLGTDTQRLARIAQARHAAQRNRIALERELREIEEAVRSAQRAAEERLAALASARLALGQAEENLRIRNQQFDVGRATSEDVLDAQALLERQRATLARALYDAHTRRAELQQLMGLPLAELAAGMAAP